MFGDGASNTGNFGETMNLAALWSLPIVFLVENNLYGMGTAIERHSAITDLSHKAEGLGVPGERVDGMDVIGDPRMRRRPPRDRPHRAQADPRRGLHLPLPRPLRRRPRGLPREGGGRRVAGARPDRELRQAPDRGRVDHRGRPRRGPRAGRRPGARGGRVRRRLPRAAARLPLRQPLRRRRGRGGLVRGRRAHARPVPRRARARGRQGRAGPRAPRGRRRLRRAAPAPRAAARPGAGEEPDDPAEEAQGRPTAPRAKTRTAPDGRHADARGAERRPPRGDGAGRVRAPDGRGHRRLRGSLQGHRGPDGAVRRARGSATRRSPRTRSSAPASARRWPGCDRSSS